MSFKNFIFFIILFFAFTFEDGKAAIKDTLFATVGNKAVTKSDIINEIKVILILNGQTFTNEKKTQLETFAIKQNIKRQIKQIEIDKYKDLEFSVEDLEENIEKLAISANMDVDTLKNTLITNEISWSYLEEQIKVELLWNSLIFQIYKNRLTINQQEIEDQLKLVKNFETVNEYLISEIIISPVPAEQLQSELDRIYNIIDEEGFEAVAISSSISDSSLKGGDLGWVKENSISQNLKSAILNTPIGNISEPIILPDGILFFKVRDKKQIKKTTDLETIKNELVNAEKSKILNMYSLTHYDKLRRSITIKYY